MIPGTVLYYGATCFTPWMRRQGDQGVLTFEVIDNPGAVGITVQIYHRDDDQYGSGEANGTATTISSSQFTTLGTPSDPLKQNVRFRIAVEAPADTPIPLSTGVMIRMLEPTWYDTANA